MSIISLAQRGTRSPRFINKVDMGRRIAAHGAADRLKNHDHLIRHKWLRVFRKSLSGQWEAKEPLDGRRVLISRATQGIKCIGCVREMTSIEQLGRATNNPLHQLQAFSAR